MFDIYFSRIEKWCVRARPQGRLTFSALTLEQLHVFSGKGHHVASWTLCTTVKNI